MRAHEGILVIEFGTGEQVKAGGVHEDFCSGCRDDEIIRVLGVGQVEFILKAGAAAGQNLHPQRLLRRFGGENFGNASGSRFGEPEIHNFTHEVYIAHCALGLKGRAV